MKPQKEDDLPLVEPSSTAKLLQIFSNEIARDGGGALVTSMKDYVANTTVGTRSLTPKRLNTLLVDSIQKPKVLAFLEAHPHIFHVDRTATPHWVILKSAKYVDWPSLTADQLHQQLITAACNSNRLAKLEDKIMYALRHRCAKMERRRRRRQQNEVSFANHHAASELPTQRNDDISKAADTGVNIVWLLSQCCWEFHEYLRATGIYLERIYTNNSRLGYSNKSTFIGQEEATSGYCTCNQVDSVVPIKKVVQPVGSRAWEDLVLEDFTSMLLRMSNEGLDCLVIDTELKKVSCVPQTTSTTTVNNVDTLSYLQTLDMTLTELVDQDGATQVRLEVLLHRYELLRRLLGGRDLWDIVQRARNNSSNNNNDDDNNVDCGDDSFFAKIDIFKEGPDIILQTKSKNRRGRMKVDREGHFSVTNGKWGNAMANTMVRCCEQVGWTAKSKNADSENENENIAAIDLTASVGGMTLGLAKTRFFKTVIGIEIDPHRAELCRQNMMELMSGESYADTVDIRTMDAMDAISKLPSRSCLVIDPPWGGDNYKKKPVAMTGQYHQLYMGTWTLDDILCKIYDCLRPCLVGLRLPVTFAVDELLERLRQRIGEPRNCTCSSDSSNPAFIETLAVRKLSVQLFVVLYFLKRDDGNE